METLSQNTDENAEDEGDDDELGGKHRVQVRKKTSTGSSGMIDLTCDDSDDEEEDGEEGTAAQPERCRRHHGPLRCETLTGDILRHEVRTDGCTYARMILWIS